MKHRRLAAAGLLALAVTFGATGAANATDDAVPTLTPVSSTTTCTSEGGDNVEIKDGVITIDGKQVASVAVTRAVPALPAEPGEPGEFAEPAKLGEPMPLGEGVAVTAAAPLPPGEPIKPGEVVAMAAPVPGDPGEPAEFGKATAVPASPLPIPPGEAGTLTADPTSPEGATLTITRGEGKSSSTDGPETVSGAKVICFSPAAPASPSE